METKLPMLFMQNIFCNMLVLYSSTEVLSFQFSFYLKFIYLFIFTLHIIIMSYSHINYLRICFDFQNL